ncbi:MAG: hypothetical protein ACOCUN_01975, partial [Jiangellaceae bacterium]
AESAEPPGEGGGGGTAGDATDTPPSPSVPAVDRVEIRASSRRVRLVGDPTVATFAVDGPHQVRRDGSSIVISSETEQLPGDETFVLLTGGRFHEVTERLQRGLTRSMALEVRVRPDLAVGVEVIAGALHAEGLPRLDHVRVTAGSLRVRDVEEPIDLLVQAGSAQLETRQTHGRSRLRCESGSLHVALGTGTDARVRDDVQLGRFTVRPDRGRPGRELVVGTGTAEIDVEVVMGTVTMEVPT